MNLSIVRRCWIAWQIAHFIVLGDFAIISFLFNCNLAIFFYNVHVFFTFFFFGFSTHQTGHLLRSNYKLATANDVINLIVNQIFFRFLPHTMNKMHRSNIKEMTKVRCKKLFPSSFSTLFFFASDRK